MERKSFAGWLLVSLLPLFAFIWMAFAQHHASTARAPIAVNQFSAELARTVSYGFVDQPIDEALSDDVGSGVVAPEHSAAVMHQHTALRPSVGVLLGATVQQKL